MTTVTELERPGRAIEGRGATVSMSGPPELLSRICDVELSLEEVRTDEPAQNISRAFPVDRSSHSTMQIERLEDVIEGNVVALSRVPS